MDATLTAKQEFCLKRLQWAVGRRRGFATSSHDRPDGWEPLQTWRLLNSAVYSLYVDCCCAGVEEHARDLLFMLRT
jgi:hypothetical protein